jgi:serine/threonine-protein kinase
MLRVSQLAALLIVSLMACPALAQELFGALAYSEKARQYGWANNHPARDAAERAALAFCSQKAGDCRVVLWFRNACGALVTGPSGHGADWGETQTAAVNKALKACRARSASCAVTRSFCTGK